MVNERSAGEMTVKLARNWKVGEEIGRGGFGCVYRCTSGKTVGALKLVPKADGLTRDMLVADLQDVRNIVPVLDSGDHEDFVALVMPLAKRSLRDALVAAGGRMAELDVRKVLVDVAETLTDLSSRSDPVVHRDIKPENVLQIDERWCLTDFGIARYAELSTAAQTHKHSGTYAYHSPERWRLERATAASDVYSFGVMAFEILNGELPFLGATPDVLRKAHLESAPSASLCGSPNLNSLIAECLYKAAGARPPAATILERLRPVDTRPQSPGRAALQQVNRQQVARKSEETRVASVARNDAERRKALLADARQSIEAIAQELKREVVESVPAAKIERLGVSGWSITLDGAQLDFDYIRSITQTAWGAWTLPFEVVATADVAAHRRDESLEYSGRQHSLWFCDAKQVGQFAWFETAFKTNPFNLQHMIEPVARDPGQEAAEALESAVSLHEVAWPFEELNIGNMEDFVERWTSWFASSIEKKLAYPSAIERPPIGSWRTS
jgi:eukaryotic-like serine/threonine-protein kinase